MRLIKRQKYPSNKEGINNVEKFFNAGILKNNNFYDPEINLVHHKLLRANHLFEKGKDYIIQNNNLKIIDELTGRIWREEDLEMVYIKL